MKKTINIFPLCFTLCCAIMIIAGCKKESSNVIPATNEILIGALLPMSTSDEGILGKASMEFSVNDFNSLMDSAGSPLRLRLILSDTKSDSATAIQALDGLYAQGVRLLAGGPGSSMELMAMMDQINNKGMLMLNAYSTAPSLAIPSDNIFRLVPDDTKQSKAISKLLEFDGIEVVIAVWRNDNYGLGLFNAFKTDFELSGGLILNSISYPANTTDFSVIAASLNNQIIQAKIQFGADNVGVCYFGIDESTAMFSAALTQSDLGSINWYGCDGNAVLNDMASDPQVAGFAKLVNFTALNVGIGTADFTPKNTAALSSRIQLSTGLQPNVNTLSAYDAVRILGYCYLATGNQDIGHLKSVLPLICTSYNYLGISRELNMAGDLMNANYIFWRIEANGASYEWRTYATYFAEGDYIEMKN